VADGGAANDLVLEHALARDPQLADRIRVIDRSPPFGIPPVVVGPEIDSELRASLQRILLNMADDTTAAPALESLGIEGFVLIDDDHYQSVRDLIRDVERAGKEVQ
jgi:phosphonate transport system substrate-binding protein